jgi:protein SCO1/2
MKTSTYFLLLLAMMVGLSGCTNGYDKQFEHSGKEKRYEIRGKVLGVDKANRTVEISHEEIKDLMPAMTMPFVVKDQWPFDVLKRGSVINATLIVDGPRSWLEDVVITEETSDTGASNGVTAAEPAVGDEVPDFTLVNQDNKKISISDYRGKTLLLTFIYTRCPIPEYCTLMSNNFAKIQQELEKDRPLYEKTHLLSVSIDPEYDTPQVLRSYGASHTGNYSEERFSSWEFAGGTKDEVRKIAQYFGLTYFGEGDQIIHGLRTAVIAPDGKIYKVYRENKWKPEEILTDVRKVNSEK